LGGGETERKRPRGERGALPKRGLAPERGAPTFLLSGAALGARKCLPASTRPV
jgi:hypothetical protein